MLKIQKLRILSFIPSMKTKKRITVYVKSKAGYYRSIEEDNTQLETVLKLVDTYLDEIIPFLFIVQITVFQVNLRLKILV